MQTDLIDQAKIMLDKYGKIKITVQIFAGMEFSRIFKNYHKAKDFLIFWIAEKSDPDFKIIIT